MDSRKLNSVVDAEAKLKEKHHGLLQDYLYLQKECVSKKRKLKESTERKVTLLDEIRFLKHRRNALLKKQLQNSQQNQEVIQSHKTYTKYNTDSSKRYMNGGASTSTSGQASQNHRPPIAPIRNSVSGGKEAAASPPVNLGKKAKNVFTNGKRADKRKISWQDPLALKV
ncbi:hypothetical protein RND81_08G085500 [Saponaria officinalis]|uniref:Uncharacterized protein n=1 Tax=Saponaria officinalis TaxID=3572 RepID=A0AAW1J549_SAPOF